MSDLFTDSFVYWGGREKHCLEGNLTPPIYPPWTSISSFFIKKKKCMHTLNPLGFSLVRWLHRLSSSSGQSSEEWHQVRMGVLVSVAFSFKAPGACIIYPQWEGPLYPVFTNGLNEAGCHSSWKVQHWTAQWWIPREHCQKKVIFALELLYYLNFCKATPLKKNNKLEMNFKVKEVCCTTCSFWH